MKISSIPQIYRNVRRWTEIISILSKYGLADWLSRVNIDFIKDRLKDRDGEILARQTREARIRMALVDLGPVFVKLGQILSMRPDLIGALLAAELKQLQTNVRADPPETVRAIIANELGQPVDELFREFDDVPLASASIGQVHAARLSTGERVVVKVQHAHIEHTVQEDLDVLAGLAQLAEMLPEFAPYRPVATTAELARVLRRELDFGREERHLQQFAVHFADNPHVHIPKAYMEFCTSRVLTMEYIDGIPVTQPEKLAQTGVDLEEVARRGANLYLEMIFQHGFFHADPHPGNLLVLPGGVIALLDFGMVGRVDERLREDIEEMLLAILNRDVPLLSAKIMRLGQTPPGLDERALGTDIAEFVDHYGTQALEHFDLAGALNEITEIIRRHHILLPAQVSLLIKVLVTLDGTARLLSPRFSILEVMRPFQRRMLLARLSPKRQLKKLRRVYYELQQLAEVLPRRVIEILDQVQAGKFDVHLEHRGLGPSVNRLVLGMLASALFLGSSVLLANRVPPLLFAESNFLGMEKISILGLSGCTISLLLGLRLLRAIGKSGHLDRRD